MSKDKELDEVLGLTDANLDEVIDGLAKADREAFEEEVAELEGLEMADQDEQGGINYPKPPEPSQYFRQPKNWYKGLGYLLEINRRQDLASQMQFHRVALKEVKKALGSKCRHLAHVKNLQGEVTFQAKMEINGKIMTFNVKADHTDPSLFTAETYKAVNDVLQKHLKSDVKGS